MQLFETFTTREIAIGIWLGIFIAFIISKRSVRISAANFLKIAFSKKLSYIYLLIIFYTAGIVYGLYTFNLWNESQLKNTVLWLLTVGLVSLFDVTDKKKVNYFKETVFDIFRATTIVQFLTELYTFNLIIELIIVPGAFLVGGMIAVGKTDKKHTPVVSFLNGILVLAGLLLIGYALFKVVTEFSSFATKGTLTEFLISPVLSLLYLPFLYLLSLIVTLEVIFIPLKREIKDRKLMIFARWQAIIHFPFSKTDLSRWQQVVLRHNIKNKKDIRDTIAIIKESKRFEKNPPDVQDWQGWSPYRAKDFLLPLGLNTKYYQPLYLDVWQAESSSLNIEDSPFSSSVSYTVQGDRFVANKLILKMNVYFPDKTASANTVFYDFADLLYKSALNDSMPKNVKGLILKNKDLSLFIKNSSVCLKKNKWIGHKFGGYDIEMVIQKMR